MTTIITPLVGVCAHSALLISIGTLAEPPGTTLAKPPWLMADVYALYSADPVETSEPGPSIEKLPAVYVKRG